MIELVIVRHAQSTDNLSGILTGQSRDPLLTDQGREQAQALRPLLRSDTFDLVLCSPATRALETARIAGFADSSMTVRDDLREKSFGGFEGKKVLEYENAIDSLDSQVLFTYKAHGGESFKDLSIRIVNLLSDLRRANPKRVLIVAHECVNRCIIAHCEKIEFSSWMRIQQRNTSIVRVGLE